MNRNKDPKNINISVRCSQKQKDILNDKAKEAGLTVSKYMLNAAIMGSEGLKKDLSKKKRIAKICELRTLINELPQSPLVEKIQKEVDDLWKI